MTAKRGAKKATVRKPATKRSAKPVSDRKRGVIILGVAALIAIVGLVLYFPLKNPGAKTGVGADGFSVFEVEGADLGAGNVVKKSIVQQELGGLVTNVEDVDVSGVVSLNGVKGQTATYYIKTKAGTQGSVYVDKWEYKNKQALDADGLYKGTGDAGKIGDLPVGYVHAVTIANEREYAMVVTKGFRAYKFAMTQPYKNVTIDEVTAQAALKRIAAKADL